MDPWRPPADQWEIAEGIGYDSGSRRRTGLVVRAEQAAGASSHSAVSLAIVDVAQCAGLASPGTRGSTFTPSDRPLARRVSILPWPSGLYGATP